MDYDVFKEVVKESIKDYMPDKSAHYSVDIKPVQKVNGTLDGLYMQVGEPGKEGMAVAPVLYLQELYKNYQSTGDLKGTLEVAAMSLSEGLEYAQGFTGIAFSEPETKLVLSLINTEQNRELLQDVPNRPFQDLSIVCRYVTGMDRDRVSSVLVTGRIMENMKLSREKLFQMAEENTKKMMPPQVADMAGILKRMFMEEGMPEKDADIMFGEMPAGIPMYVVTNSCQINGAVSMLFEDILHGLAEKTGTDLYILPSSVHEVIAVPADIGSPETLAEMVEEVNLGQVPLNERLSNQVYYYEKEQRRLSMATDTPAKRLDGTASEKSKNHEKKQR